MSVRIYSFVPEVCEGDLKRDELRDTVDELIWEFLNCKSCKANPATSRSPGASTGVKSHFQSRLCYMLYNISMFITYNMAHMFASFKI